MNRINKRFRRKAGETAGMDNSLRHRAATSSDHDCCGDESKRVGFPPDGASEGTLRSTQVPWLAIR